MAKLAKSADEKTDFSKAPQPSVDRIEELAGRILEGDILLPQFQRDFVWSKAQIIELWDSISKNYPVGSVLLWRSREELKAERSIADLKIAQTKEDYPVNYLLDGQQRLSSVCGALYWKGNDPKQSLEYCLRPTDKIIFASNNVRKSSKSPNSAQLAARSGEILWADGSSQF